MQSEAEAGAAKAMGRLAAAWAGRGRVPRRWGRGNRREFAMRLATCWGLITASVLGVGLFERYGGPVSIIWIANGILLAYLLLVPRRHWPAYLAVGLAGLIVGSVLIHEPWRENLLFNGLDILEVITGAFLLRKHSKRSPNFTKGAYVLRFLAFAVVGGPLVSGCIYALVQALWWHGAPLPVLSGWIIADGLGMGVTCPIFVAIFRARHGPTESLRKNWPCLVLLVIVTLGVFAQVSAPLCFLIYPVLILILLRLGLGWAAACCLFVTFAGGWLTVQGRGPLALADHLSMQSRCAVLQVFVASGVFMLYSVSVVLETRRAIEKRLEKIASVHALVSENSRDAIIVSDLKGNRTYVSAAAERLVGWPPDKFAAMGSLELVHPADLAHVRTAVHHLFKGGEHATIECRVRKSDGSYTWVEASLRLLRDSETGAPCGVLNIVRDAAERKKDEKKLKDAYAVVESLALTDQLTGIANRRRFDQLLSSEWRRGMRDQTPLSVLMIDADRFKSYNDLYGHTRGDGCLKQIAESALDVVARPGDLVARFGGEEFAVILPETDNEGAVRLATEICAAVRSRKLPHEGNAAGVVTVSVGCATMIPTLGHNRVYLVELADEALYSAKDAGRNRVRNGNLLDAVFDAEMADTQTAELETYPLCAQNAGNIAQAAV